MALASKKLVPDCHGDQDSVGLHRADDVFHVTSPCLGQLIRNLAREVPSLGLIADIYTTFERSGLGKRNCDGLLSTVQCV